MAAVVNDLKTLRMLVRMGLGNVDKETVSDEEIDYHLSMCQEILNKEGKVLRETATTSSVVNQERYNLPSDCVNILRIDYDGKKMKLINYDDITELDVS
jgi:hypothetical protein